MFLPCNSEAVAITVLLQVPRPPAFRPVLAFPLTVATFPAPHLSFASVRSTMPGTTVPSAPHYVPAPVTQEDSECFPIFLVRVASYVAILTRGCSRLGRLSCRRYLEGADPGGSRRARPGRAGCHADIRFHVRRESRAFESSGKCSPALARHRDDVDLGCHAERPDGRHSRRSFHASVGRR